jgi:hypothetical protein
MQREIYDGREDLINDEEIMRLLGEAKTDPWKSGNMANPRIRTGFEPEVTQNWLQVEEPELGGNVCSGQVVKERYTATGLFFLPPIHRHHVRKNIACTAGFAETMRRLPER